MKPKFIFNNPQAAMANIDLVNLSKNAKFIRNDFWREVFKSIPDLMQKFLTKQKAMIPICQYLGERWN